MSRRRPNFLTRTAEEDVSRLDPNEPSESSGEYGRLLPFAPTTSPHQEELNPTVPTERHGPSWPSKPFRGLGQCWTGRKKDKQGYDASQEPLIPHMSSSAGHHRDTSVDKKDKHGHRSRSTEEPKKLGTFSGVFVPTTLNVLSILMFIRFGFILGQAGLLGILGAFYLTSKCVNIKKHR